MREVVQQAQDAVREGVERVMEAEIELFLGRPEEASHKRNGYVSRSFGIKGVGVVTLRVPRDRSGRFNSHVIAARRGYDEATERDLALLNLAGLSTRMLAMVSHTGYARIPAGGVQRHADYRARGQAILGTSLG